MSNSKFGAFMLLVAAKTVLTASPAWVERSNQNAMIPIGLMARFSPEGAGQLGVDGLDSDILDLKPQTNERLRSALRGVLAELDRRMTSERDPLVRQDLDILIRSTKDAIRGSELQEQYQVPYFDMDAIVFGGIRALLDDQVAAERRPAALTRLKRYAGLEAGYTPVTVLAEQRTRERMSKPGLLWPAKAEVEKNLTDAQFYIDGIGQLFEKYKIGGYQEPYAKLREQLGSYNAFVKSEMLPKSRTDFRLPPELYAFNLEQYGVDIPPADLAAKAHAAFSEIQKEMQTVATQLAKENAWKSTDYRDVIRHLKEDQIVGESILPHYEKRLAQIEVIIRREHLVTLPDRPARIRLASAAESTQVPAPNMHPPRLLNNQGERGEFVLPLNVPSKDGKMQSFDDFTFDAASWTLTAHEARPGHELQFDSMVEHGVSVARAVFAFNSTNVEGWGLYAEWVLKPYMPLDGQLISLQHRLLRAARAFLDPELHMGKVTPEDALRVLKEDVVLSDAMANQEVERYMFRSPAQACSYFYGYTKLIELRADTERMLGPKFNAQRFHDFVLSQGLLPPGLLRKAVLAEFVNQNRPAA